MSTELRADLGVFPVVEVSAKAEVLQVDGLLFAFVYEARHLLWRGNLEGSNTTHDHLEFIIPTVETGWNSVQTRCYIKVQL